MPMIEPDDWSQLSRHREMPRSTWTACRRTGWRGVREQLRRSGVVLGVFVSPVSLRCRHCPASDAVQPLRRTSHR